MSANDNAPAPAIAPPLVILICIAGAVMVVVVSAAMYRICRQSRAESDNDLEGKGWSPNKRNKDQDKYMEEVRCRNNAMAWESANVDRREYRRGWFREHIEEQRSRDQSGWTPGEAVSAEEYLSHVKDNPYQDLLDKKARQSERINSQILSPRRNFESVYLGKDSMEGQLMHAGANDAVSPEIEQQQQASADPNIKITVNDESKDIVDAEVFANNKFAPRASRMFRSSSVYSGEGLLPTSHLHLVQSSSNYALRNEQSPKLSPAIREGEEKGIAL